MDQEPVRGGAYINLRDDTKLGYRVDPDGEGVEIVAFGLMELSIGMTPQVLRRYRDVIAEAYGAVAAARASDDAPAA